MCELMNYSTSLLLHRAVSAKNAKVRNYDRP